MFKVKKFHLNPNILLEVFNSSIQDILGRFSSSFSAYFLITTRSNDFRTIFHTSLSYHSHMIHFHNLIKLERELLQRVECLLVSSNGKKVLSFVSRHSKKPKKIFAGFS